MSELTEPSVLLRDAESDGGVGQEPVVSRDGRR